MLFNPKASCKDCPSGYSTKTYSISAYCSSCSPGYFQNETGGEKCKPCSTGTFMSDSESKIACKECVTGQYQDEEGEAKCKSCPAGKWSNKVQAKNENDCLDCQIGKYSASLSIDVDCIFCPAGTRGKNGVTGGTNITVCQSCAKGQYRNGSDPVATSCRNCPMGYYNDDEGQGSCLPCIPVSFNAGKFLLY
jgi:hypothetical protein